MSKYLIGCGNIPKVFANKLYMEDLKRYFDHEFSDKSLPEVVAIGSGAGSHEAYLRDGLHLKVVAYDNNPKKVSIHYASLPEDNEKILPLDCSRIILFSAYPQGYLGAILDTYKRRGGNMLCVVVEGDLMTSMHAGFEPDAVSYLEDDYERETLLGRTIKDMPRTDIIIGGAILGFCNASTNICFYGAGWHHESLQEISKSYSYESMIDYQKQNFSHKEMYESFSGAVDEGDEPFSVEQPALLSKTGSGFFYSDSAVEKEKGIGLFHTNPSYK